MRTSSAQTSPKKELMPPTDETKCEENDRAIGSAIIRSQGRGTNKSQCEVQESEEERTVGCVRDEWGGEREREEREVRERQREREKKKKDDEEEDDDDDTNSSEMGRELCLQSGIVNTQ